MLLLLAAVGLVLPAVAKAPGKKDPEKLAQKLVKAVDGRKWDDAISSAADGLAMVERGSEWDQLYGEEMGVDMRLLWEKTLRGAIETTTELGDKKRDREIQRVALELVGPYLARWPDHSKSYEMTYLQGELAWEVKEFREAADAYKRLHEMNPNTGRLMHHAAAGWVVSLWFDAGDNWEFFDSQADLVREERKDLTDLIARCQPIDVTAEEQELIAAMDAFVAAAYEHRSAPELLYRVIYLYHSRYQATDGVMACVAYLQSFSEHDKAHHVARMLVDLATWSERESQIKLRVKAMGLNWDDIVEQGARSNGDPPRPMEPDRVDLMPRE